MPHEPKMTAEEAQRWANQQRRLRQRGGLSQEQIDKLNAAGFTWEIQPVKPKTTE